MYNKFYANCFREIKASFKFYIILEMQENTNAIP